MKITIDYLNKVRSYLKTRLDAIDEGHVLELPKCILMKLIYEFFEVEENGKRVVKGKISFNENDLNKLGLSVDSEEIESLINIDDSFLNVDEWVSMVLFERNHISIDEKSDSYPTIVEDELAVWLSGLIHNTPDYPKSDQTKLIREK